MEITYDPGKNAKNVAERDLSFDRAIDFHWAVAQVKQDTRKDYPEIRYTAIGCLEGRLHVICFSETKKGIRVISFRKANKREEKGYEEAIANNQ